MPEVESMVANEVQIPAGLVTLRADVVIPPAAIGVVLFAHGSGSSRHSPRNRFVAEELNDGGIGTVLADLLTEAEERTERGGEFRFDITMLTGRLTRVAAWLREYALTASLPLGLFGASTGAAAALDTAAVQADVVRAVVSRGGRPDLAKKLENVKAPTLLIVGGNDGPVIRLNESAMGSMNCVNRLEIVPGATHLFEEPGCLERVAVLAKTWFTQYLK